MAYTIRLASEDTPRAVEHSRSLAVSHLPARQAKATQICGISYLCRGSVRLVVDGQFHIHTFIVTTAL